jgi:hypothetical protein
LARTYLISRTCSALSSDMSGYRVLRVYKGPLPLRTLASLYLPPLNLLRCPSALKAILVLLHRTPLVSRRFDSPTLRDLRTLVGFLSSKVFSRILQDFFVLHQSIPIDVFLCLVVPLGCLSPDLSLA